MFLFFSDKLDDATVHLYTLRLNKSFKTVKKIKFTFMSGWKLEIDIKSLFCEHRQNNCKFYQFLNQTFKNV